MSWGDLIRLGVTLRPYDDPPRSGGKPSPFDAPFAATLETLRRELEQLDARKIVLQVGYRDQDLRVDGMPRANAKLNHGGAALSFESKYGALRYETNEFVVGWGEDSWKANLRAIALGMEALRKVDRYGVSKRGQQYRGWRQIEAKSSAPEDALVTPEDARRFLDEHGGTFKAAASRLHPDRGGDPGLMRAALRARDILGADA